MKLPSYKVTFEVKTILESKEILSRLKDNVDFNHKNKLSTSQIQNEFYGDIIKENHFKIWKTPGISGFMDKGLSPTIEVFVDKDILRIKIEDYMFAIFLAMSGTAIIIGLMLIIQGYQHKEFVDLMYAGMTVICFSLIAYSIKSWIFKLTTRRIRELTIDRLTR